MSGRRAGHSQRWFVDESMIAVGKALAAVRNDLIYPGHPDCPIARGTPDEDWWPSARSGRTLHPVGHQPITLGSPVADALVAHGHDPAVAADDRDRHS